MPHRCAVCNKTYENYAVEIVQGCVCGSKIFVYQRPSIDQPQKIVQNMQVSREGTSPGPAAGRKVDFVKEVKSAAKKISTGKKSKKIEFDLDTIKVIKDGVYEININRILNNEPLIIEMKEDGKYFIHLASVFQKKIDKIEHEDLELDEKPKRKTTKKTTAKKK